MAGNKADDKLTGRARVLLADRTLAQLNGDSEQIQLQLEPMDLAEIRQLTGPTTIPDSIRALQGLAGTARLFPNGGDWRGAAVITSYSIHYTKLYE